MHTKPWPLINFDKTSSISLINGKSVKFDLSAKLYIKTLFC